MIRIALVFVLFVSSAAARVGEKLEEYEKQWGKLVPVVAKGIDFAATRWKNGVKIHLQVWKGLIALESHAPIEPQDVEALLDAQKVGKFGTPFPVGVRKVTYFETVDEKYYAVYDASEKKLLISLVEFGEHLSKIDHPKDLK
jgi:hypothetical protein